jgi:hypothetical protein
MRTTKEAASEAGRALPANDTPEMRAFTREQRAKKNATFARAFVTALREHSLDLIETLQTMVDDGIARGWVRVEKWGYARASLAETRWEEIVPLEHPNRWEELRRLRDADHESVMADYARLLPPKPTVTAISKCSLLQLTTLPTRHAARHRRERQG